MALVVNEQVRISEQYIELLFVRSGGPGGQNVNKVSSAVQVVFDLAGCHDLTPAVKQRLRGLAGRRLTATGKLVLRCETYRSQHRNRAVCLERLRELVARALERPKRRRPTRPTAASRQRRLQAKRHRSHIKALRRGPVSEE